jgi:hypothetical protein
MQTCHDYQQRSRANSGRRGLVRGRHCLCLFAHFVCLARSIHHVPGWWPLDDGIGLDVGRSRPVRALAWAGQCVSVAQAPKSRGPRRCGQAVAYENVFRESSIASLCAVNTPTRRRPAPLSAMHPRRRAPWEAAARCAASFRARSPRSSRASAAASRPAPARVHCP